MLQVFENYLLWQNFSKVKTLIPKVISGKGFFLLIFLLFSCNLFRLYAQQISGPYDGREASKMPRLGLGYGIFTYFGDIKDNTFNHPFTSSSGGELTIERNINHYLNFYVKAVAGRISVNERSAERNLNFRSSLFISSANLLYNFNNFYKKPKVLQPYIGAGVGFFNFDSKTDLRDAIGNTYYYWNDGSIRNQDENSLGAEGASIINRDYDYETDLRSLNTEGRGKYSTLALTIPVEFGALFRVSPRLSFKLGTTYYVNFTNSIDNITEKGVGIMQGKKGGDHFLFTSFNLSFNLFKEKVEQKQQYFEAIPDSLFAGLEDKDSDEDGVPDFIDECAATQKGVLVTKTGCPLDDDNDGIENFRDEEEKSTIPNPPVTVDGRNFTDSIIAQLQSIDSIAFVREQIEIVFAKHIKIYGYPVKNFRQNLVDSLTVIGMDVTDAKIDSLFKAIDKEYEKRQREEKLAREANDKKSVQTEITSGKTIVNVSLPQVDTKPDNNTAESSSEKTIDPPKTEALSKPTTSKTNSKSIIPETETEPELLTDAERKAIEQIVSKNENTVNELTETENASINPIVESSKASENINVEKAITESAKQSAAEPIKKVDNKETKGNVKGADLVPAEFKSFDFNGDGVLTGDEILKAIDLHTDGLLKVSSDELFDMIDFYNSKMKNAKVIDYGVSKGIYIDGVLKIVKKDQIVEQSTTPKRTIPSKFAKADFNNDGVITNQEVDEIIKRHKAGNKLYSKEYTNELIDWFFED